MLRATHISSIDKSTVVQYNGFRDLIDYYAQMSALGDVSAEEFDTNILPNRRIHQLAVPLLVVHALDDPLITWRTVAANRGARHPANLTTTGKGNLMLLLTKAGGHVGWPIGWFPSRYSWYWMNNVASSFAQSVQSTKGIAAVAN
jgi:predicted alpha/beta-fold hydrolase